MLVRPNPGIVSQRGISVDRDDEVPLLPWKLQKFYPLFARRVVEAKCKGRGVPAAGAAEEKKCLGGEVKSDDRLRGCP
jgi:hypothetical protein